MKSFTSLSPKQQVKRLQRLAQSALRAYDLPEAKLTPLAFLNNAVFKSLPSCVTPLHSQTRSQRVSKHSGKLPLKEGNHLSREKYIENDVYKL